MTSSNATEKKYQITKLWLIIAIAFVPLLLAASLYFSQAWSPSGRVNQGVLYTPPLTLNHLTLHDSQQAKLGDISASQKWQLIFIASEEDPATEQSLHLMRQVHKALGKNKARIERNLVTLSNLPVAKQKEINSEYPSMRTLTTQQEYLLKFFSDNTPQVPALYICDPLGNIMLGYKAELIGKPLLKDLKRLLKLSKIG